MRYMNDLHSQQTSLAHLARATVGGYIRLQEEINNAALTFSAAEKATMPSGLVFG